MPKYLQQDRFFVLYAEQLTRALEVVEVLMKAYLLEAEVVEAVQDVAADIAVAFEGSLHAVL